MQRSVKRVTLQYVPLNVVYGVVDYFEHVEELKCRYIQASQQVHLLVVYIIVGRVHLQNKQLTVVTDAGNEQLLLWIIQLSCNGSYIV